MRLKLLDILTCPTDGFFPLKIEEKKAVDSSQSDIRRCRVYCGLISGNPSSVSEEDCAGCRRQSITEALLYCEKCGGIFEVVEGIPKLIPSHFNNSAEANDKKELKDKKTEMKSRDEGAAGYDRMTALSLLSLVEKPLTLKMAALEGMQMVVELGCGTGRFTVDIAERAGEVIAVDLSLESLRLCREKSGDKTVHHIQADINHLPFRDGVFDKAISCQVFEHIPSPKLRRHGLSEVSRILKDDGEFTVSVYRDFWFSKILGKKEGYHDGGIYYYRFNPEEFVSFLSEHFDVLSHKKNVGNYIQLARCRKR